MNWMSLILLATYTMNLLSERKMDICSCSFYWGNINYPTRLFDLNNFIRVNISTKHYYQSISAEKNQITKGIFYVLHCLSLKKNMKNIRTAAKTLVVLLLCLKKYVFVQKTPVFNLMFQLFVGIFMILFGNKLISN